MRCWNNWARGVNGSLVREWALGASVLNQKFVSIIQYLRRTPPLFQRGRVLATLVRAAEQGAVDGADERADTDFAVAICVEGRTLGERQVAERDVDAADELADADVAAAVAVADAGADLADVAEQERAAREDPDESVGIAVAVDVGERGFARAADVAQADDRSGDEARGGRAPRILEKEGVAGARSDEGVEIAVAVDVGKGGRAFVADIAQPEGVVQGAREGWRGGVTIVLKEDGIAGATTDEDVEIAVAVAVDVGECGDSGDSVTTDVEEAEGSCLRGGECRGRGGPGILEEESLSVVPADEGVEIAVAVDVGERRSRVAAADVGEAEGVGTGCGERGGSGVAVSIGGVCVAVEGAVGTWVGVGVAGGSAQPRF